MPTHIYQRVGRYHDAVEWNLRAAAVDEEYLAWCRSGGFYPAAYYPHNVHFVWSAATMEGRSALAIESARKLVEKTTPEMFRTWPPLEALAPTPWLALARFAKWDAILAEPAPPAEFGYSTGIWHYARGLAFARTGRVEEARAELAEVAKRAEDPALAPVHLGGGTAGELLGIARRVLASEIAGAREEKDERIRLLEEAVVAYDALPYYEPQGWDHPPRLLLGEALLEAGRGTEAEFVYREDLAQHRSNGWALLGLARALEAQGQTEAAAEVRALFTEAWRHADVELSGSRL
jgi:tetratricopeptide (TPR) repeat protein